MKRIQKITAIFSVLMLFSLCLKAQVKHKIIHRHYSLALSIANGKRCICKPAYRATRLMAAVYKT